MSNFKFGLYAFTLIVIMIIGGILMYHLITEGKKIRCFEQNKTYVKASPRWGGGYEYCGDAPQDNLIEMIGDSIK